MTHGSSHGKLLHVGAHRIRQCLDTYQRRFKEITSRARVRFEERDWPGMQADASGKARTLPRRGGSRCLVSSDSFSWPRSRTGRSGRRWREMYAE